MLDAAGSAMHPPASGPLRLARADSAYSMQSRASMARSRLSRCRRRRRYWTGTGSPVDNIARNVTRSRTLPRMPTPTGCHQKAAAWQALGTAAGLVASNAAKVDSLQPSGMLLRTHTYRMHNVSSPSDATMRPPRTAAALGPDVAFWQRQGRSIRSRSLSATCWQHESL